MIRTRLCLLGLCAMVFGLMAFTTGAAQAETGSEWLLAEKNGTNLIPFLEAEVELKKDGIIEYPYVLHSEILKIKVLYLCKDLRVGPGLSGNPKLTTLGAITSGIVLFSGCLTNLNGVKNANCTPSDAVHGPGTIVTKILDGLLKLHELVGGARDDILQLLPHRAGDPFAVIETGAACAIGTKVPVIGKLFLKDCNDLALTHLVEHLVEPFEPLTKLFTISETAEHTATLLGSAWGYLKGAHEGIKFSSKQ